MKLIEVKIYLEDHPEPGEHYLTEEEIRSAIRPARKLIEKQYTGLIVSSFSLSTIKEANE